MDTIEQRKATEADAISLAPRLRVEDVMEIEAASEGKMTPLESLLHGVRMSEPAMTVYRTSDGLPIAMYGVVPAEPLARVGVVWMLGSPEIASGRCCVSFLRRCRDIVSHLSDTYPVLTNMIDARNAVHIRWIEWCGFEVDQCVHVGENMFYVFRKVNDLCASPQSR